MGIVYMITNILNNKSYIGGTMRPFEDRIKEHLKGDGNCRALIVAIRKYGTNAFAWKILINGIETRTELDTAEAHMIEDHGTLIPNGYNLQEGGANGKMSKEARKKISDGLKKKALDPEWIAKLSEGKRRLAVNLEYRAKISAGLIRKWKDPEYRAKKKEAWNKRKQEQEDRK